ncbi:MAG: RagB/SusD family nutrient uptake outer membrane protein [Muribaculaceae bacterium]|nr:RagB/SusD family nutrient uptake outer membrane protein [Muribaculaceae bacterium]
MAQPTAELADMYEFSDGTEFDWNTYAQKHSDPYTDREPRFHATILYNGAKWENRTIETFVGANDEIADGTDSYKPFTINDNGSVGHSCTGYYLRKYLQEGNAQWPTDASYNTDNVIRYAEVLLNKAEALAQLNYTANATEAFAALNRVRKRVGLPEKTTGDAADLDAFMALIRHERAVELAGENLRYWDIRRWKLGEVMINGTSVHGTKITKNADGSLTYEKVDADDGMKRIFTKDFYYMPLPTTELAQNGLCTDNW